MTDTTTTTEPATTNALSILLAALPSSVASSYESEFNTLFDIATPTSQSQQTTSTSSHPTSQPTSTTTSMISSKSSQSTLSTPSTLVTIAANHTPSASTSSTATISSTASPSASSTSTTGPHQIRNASVAGIVTGVAAGVVVLLLLGLFLFRRRQQGKAPFGRHGSQRSKGSRRIFPEVAWLYDPRRSPTNSGSPIEESHPGGQSRAPSAVSLIPEPREGTVEMAETRSHSPSPYRLARPSSPLLAPESAIGIARTSDERRRSDSRSPVGGRSASNSPIGKKSRSSMGQSRTDLARPLTAIWEETPRLSTDGLLHPGPTNLQRHST